jgi:MFS family permease
MRPIGGIVLGLYADRAGRKAALSLVIALMTLGILLLAIAPPYSAIGIGTPLMIVVGRMLQGFSAGGDRHHRLAARADLVRDGRTGAVDCRGGPYSRPTSRGPRCAAQACLSDDRAV